MKLQRKLSDVFEIKKLTISQSQRPARCADLGTKTWVDKRKIKKQNGGGQNKTSEATLLRRPAPRDVFMCSVLVTQPLKYPGKKIMDIVSEESL